MKNFAVLFIFFQFFSVVYAQKKDSIVYISEYMTIIKHSTSNRFTINSKTTKLENVKFVQQIHENFQVLDDQNSIFYVNPIGEINENNREFYGLCGTVPHYTLSILEKNDVFEIYKDETFYDRGNQIPAKKIRAIPKTMADEVLFINGQKTFNFSENFGVISIGKTNPKTIIIKKDSHFATYENPKLTYDEIDFTNYENLLVTKKGNLYGILGYFEPKYKSISKFNQYLAEAILPNGTKIFIDIKGNEY